MATTNLPTRMASAPRRDPPVVPGQFLLGNVRDVQRRAMDFFLEIARDHGDVAQVRLLNRTTYVVSHPDGIRQVLQRNHPNYDRNIQTQRPLRYFLGDGLAISDGALWRQQRRLMQPAFHRERVSALATTITAAATSMLDGWQARVDRDEVVDMHEQMPRVTLRVVGAALFGLDLADERDPLGRTFETMVRALAEYVFLPFPPLAVPTPRNRRIRATVRALDGMVADVIQQRRRDGADNDDLLSMLLAARDADGQALDDRQLRDEIISMLFAGHETTANTLAWACLELARHPEVQDSLRQEVGTVLEGRCPTEVDLARLPGTRSVIDEVLRLYPPSFALMRHAVADDELRGYLVPGDSLVWTNVCGAHRHPDFWTEPETFNPDRFAAGGQDTGVQQSYFPFGAGPHLCIGNTLAVMEAHLILAMVLQRYELRPAWTVPVRPVVELTVRPRGGVPVLLHAV